MSLSRLQFEILDAMADDIESVEQIYRAANDLWFDEPVRLAKYRLAEIMDEVVNMLDEGYIRARATESEALAPLNRFNPQMLHYYWFGYTEKGRKAWSAYQDDEEGKPSDRD